MADADVATKAPENDASEISGIQGDTKPDQSPATMGEHCTTDRPTPAGATPTGEMTKYNDVDVYITKPADYPHSPSKLLLLLTGGTGVHSTNNQLQADKYAEEGFVVVMPDQFAGDPAPTTTTTAQPTDSQPSLIDQVKLSVASVAKSFTIDMWLARHTPTTVLPILHALLPQIREEFADAYSTGDSKGIYCVGYCFGAKYALLLAHSHLPSDVAAGQKLPEAGVEEGMRTQGPQVKCVAVAHGTDITVPDLEGVSENVPLCVVAVEGDVLFPDHVREEGMGKVRGEKEVEVYGGVPHGFAVLGDYEEEGIVEKQGEAFGKMVGWLRGH